MHPWPRGQADKALHRAWSGVHKSQSLLDGHQTLVHPVKAACMMGQGLRMVGQGFLDLAASEFQIAYAELHTIRRSPNIFQVL